MKNQNIELAIFEANRFIAKAKELLEAKEKFFESNEHRYFNDAPKQSGALRRASLDLTRSLAEMRKP